MKKEGGEQMKRDFAVAVKAIIIREEKALILHRSPQEIESSYMNRREKWDMPGGGIHYFEHSSEGLIREIREETNLSVKIIKPLSLFDVIKPHIHLCIFTYVCLYEAGEVQLSAEHDRYLWLTLEQMSEYDIPNWMKRDFKQAFLEIEWEKQKNKFL